MKPCIQSLFHEFLRIRGGAYGIQGGKSHEKVLKILKSITMEIEKYPIQTRNYEQEFEFYCRNRVKEPMKTEIFGADYFVFIWSHIKAQIINLYWIGGIDLNRVLHDLETYVKRSRNTSPFSNPSITGRKRKREVSDYFHSKKLKLEDRVKGFVEYPNTSEVFGLREYASQIDAKDIVFRVIKNDGKLENLLLLNQVKCLMQHQLPNMPKHYVTRLVFDLHHRSLVALLGTVAIGAITYRPFYPQGFHEIAFVAVDGSYQIKGCGRLLMNNLKNYCCQEGKAFRFLTYADNSAIDFFKKMGFSSTVTMPDWRYAGYIKYYTDVTLMECMLRPGIDYCNHHLVLAKQIELVSELVNNRKQTSHLSAKEYPGLYFSSKSKPYTDPKGKRIKSPNEIPGVEISGNTTVLEQSSRDLDHFKSQLQEIFRKVEQLEDSWPFQQPVDPDEAEDYYEVIQNPVDLSMIERRLERGFYRNIYMFIGDFYRMFNNCRHYNGEDSAFAGFANSCEHAFKELLKKNFFSLGIMEQ